MTSTTLRTVTVVTAVGSGLVGGVYFAFSAFVMRALHSLPPAEGLRAMQAVNVEAPSPAFMTALFGTALGTVVVMVAAVPSAGSSEGRLRLAGGGLSLLSLALTIAYHVPRNDALALLDPAAAGSARAWNTYVSHWTALNTVRAASALAGSVLLTLAVRSD